mgnify:CR=1 FL=1
MTCADERVFHIYFTTRMMRHHVRILWESLPLSLPSLLEQSIHTFWQTLPKTHIFNGTVARLDTWEWSSDRRGLHLYLRPSEYRTLLYSNAHVSEICAAWGRRYLANVLGISAVLLSADKHIVFMKRSQDVGEFPGCFDVFGGHIDVSASHNAPCVFAAMEQELDEEVNLAPADYDLELIGLLKSVPNQKPELVFLATSLLSTSEILKRAQRARDRHEYSDFHWVSDGHELQQFLTTRKEQFSPSAFGSLCVFEKIDKERVGN